ncbi:hypothetical protein H6F88_31745 [Oculatella sp. FACHB-28]|uniref:hypothetical protein n=1 Tax=Oculatella sp. FACHB-28 TaxID=2692845 RepID=UPI0016865F91|nr:hypothetical protein [Oculatella sp. FACHB-28]MBD2060517.1 hypothetical protein [Oculatella sp. FACHB-28]
MLQFDPPELREQFNDAVKEWVDKLSIQPENLFRWIDASTEEDFDPNEDRDQTITLNTRLGLYSPWCKEEVVISCEDFIDSTEECKCTNLIENRICRSQKRSLIRIEAMNEAASLFSSFSIPAAEPGDMRTLGEIIGEETEEEFLEKRTSMEIRNDEIEEELAEFYWERDFGVGVIQRLEKPTRRYCIQNTQINGHNILCSITQGFTIFGIMLAFERRCTEKYLPINEDIFVEIRFDQQIPKSLEESILEAYLFELSSSLTIDFKVSPRLDYDDIDLSYEEFENHNFNPRFRPLLIGKGMTGLLELYNRATASTDPEVQILFFTKVIEYVSQTVIRTQSHKAIRDKLLSPRALQPDASFIKDLEETIESQQKYKKDKEAIQETVSECCEITDLARIAPPFLKDLKNYLTITNQKEKEKRKSEILKQFGASLSSTRNEVAHAKANYTPSGDECPPEQLTEFANCAKLAAQQVIRWYQLVPESTRLP